VDSALPNCHAAARAQITHFTRAHQRVEGVERLLNRCREIPSVDLIKVDVIHLEPPQGILARLDHMLATESALILPWTHRPVQFGREHDIVARSHLAQPAPGDFLAATVRVNVGCIEEIDSALKRDREMLARLISIERPIALHRPRGHLAAAIAHAAEADA